MTSADLCPLCPPKVYVDLDSGSCYKPPRPPKADPPHPVLDSPRVPHWQQSPFVENGKGVERESLNVPSAPLMSLRELECVI